MSPHRLNSLYESNEIAVFLIRVKMNKEKKKHERMIVVISSSKTMTVTQQVTARHEKKITPAAGITFQQTQHGEHMIAVCPRYKNHQIQEKLALASKKKNNNLSIYLGQYMWQCKGLCEIFLSLFVCVY